MQTAGAESGWAATPTLLLPSLPRTSPPWVPLPGHVQASRYGAILTPKVIDGIIHPDVCLSLECLPRKEEQVFLRTTGMVWLSRRPSVARIPKARQAEASHSPQASSVTLSAPTTLEMTGMELMPPILGVQNLNHWTAREVPTPGFNCVLKPVWGVFRVDMSEHHSHPGESGAGVGARACSSQQNLLGWPVHSLDREVLIYQHSQEYLHGFALQEEFSKFL